jgi:hypothetical protein
MNCLEFVIILLPSPYETCNVYRWNFINNHNIFKKIEKLSAAAVFAVAKKGLQKRQHLILLFHIQNYNRLLLKFSSSFKTHKW